MMNVKINTGATAIISRAGDEGFTGIVHRSAHKATPLQKHRQ